MPVSLGGSLGPPSESRLPAGRPAGAGAAFPVSGRGYRTPSLRHKGTHFYHSKGPE